MADFIAYYRVSTKKQDYGLEAQRRVVEQFITSRGGTLLAAFSEKESGRNNARPELGRAVACARRHGATLLIAKLDRLSRNVSFLFTLKEELREAGIPIIAADMPDVLNNTLTLAVMAGLAQQERELISERTKQGLAVARSRGKRIGRPKGYDPVENRLKGVESIRRQAQERALRVLPIVLSLRKAGNSLRQIAGMLNLSGYKTARGCLWTPTAVRRIVLRAADLPGRGSDAFLTAYQEDRLHWYEKSVGTIR